MLSASFGPKHHSKNCEDSPTINHQLDVRSSNIYIYIHYIYIHYIYTHYIHILYNYISFKEAVLDDPPDTPMASWDLRCHEKSQSAHRSSSRVSDGVVVTCCNCYNPHSCWLNDLKSPYFFVLVGQNHLKSPYWVGKDMLKPHLSSWIPPVVRVQTETPFSGWPWQSD